MDHNTDDHDYSTWAQSYRDAAAYIDAWRDDNGSAISRIEDGTACVPCLLHCTAVTAGLLGDQAVVESAAATAMDNLIRRASEG